MSFKKDTLITYAAQGYVSFVGFIFVPVFVVLLGEESFGLISIFLMLQTWMYLLDMGLSNTLSRETSKFKTKKYSKKDFTRLLLFTKYFYIIISLLIVISFLALSNVFATQWVKVESIPSESVSYYFKIMGFVVCLRWLYVPLRSFLVGMGEFYCLSVVDVLSATLRTPVCILFLLFFEGGVEEYFIAQLIVSVFTFLVFLLLYKIKINDLISSKVDTESDIEIKFSEAVKFAMQMFFTVLVWMLISQFDKLYLSQLLSLTLYGYLSIAILISGIITLISAPFSVVFLPKLVELIASERYTEYTSFYLKSANILLSLLLPTCLIIALFSSDILYIWTGSEDIAGYGAEITSLYALGNMFLLINAFAYYIQYSYGQLKLHVLSTIFAALICVPTFIYMGENYGAVGTGWVWLGYNIIFTFFWLPYIQIRFLGTLVARVFFFRTVGLLVTNTAIGLGLRYLSPDLHGLYQLIYIGVCLLIMVLINFLTSSDTYNLLRSFLMKAR